MNVIKLADWVNANLFEAHRGAFKSGRTFVLFGNEGLGDSATLAELEYVFKWVRERNHEVLSFGMDSENFTWVMVIRPTKKVTQEALTEMLFDAWQFGLLKRDPNIDMGAMWAMYRTTQTIEAMSACYAPIPKSIAVWLKELAKYNVAVR